MNVCIYVHGSLWWSTKQSNSYVAVKVIKNVEKYRFVHNLFLGVFKYFSKVCLERVLQLSILMRYYVK